MTAASSAARNEGRPRVKSRTKSVKPIHVYSGTAQFRAAGPNHLPISPGTMYQHR